MEIVVFVSLFLCHILKLTERGKMDVYALRGHEVISFLCRLLQIVYTVDKSFVVRS